MRTFVRLNLASILWTQHETKKNGAYYFFTCKDHNKKLGKNIIVVKRLGEI